MAFYFKPSWHHYGARNTTVLYKGRHLKGQS